MTRRLLAVVLLLAGCQSSAQPAPGVPINVPVSLPANMPTGSGLPQQR
jgi:hypothetical protein